MQHDHVLKILKFYLLTPSPRSGGGSVGKIFATIFATMLLHGSFPLIDMKHGHILKKCKFWPLSHYLSSPRGQTQAFDLKSQMICFIFIVPLSV